ncbi:hypothetical protein ACTFIZ_008626 [Dictyostelium cf. discoideum]
MELFINLTIHKECKSFSSRDLLAISNNQNKQYTINGTIDSQIEKKREELSISDIDRVTFKMRLLFTSNHIYSPLLNYFEKEIDLAKKFSALQNISYMHADSIKRSIREYLKLNISSIKPEQLLINIANDHLKYNIQAYIALLN